MAGILVPLGFFAAMGKAVLDDTIFISVSVYNLLVILTLLVAIVTIVFSWRAFKANPPQHWWHAVIVIVGVLMLEVHTIDQYGPRMCSSTSV